MQTERFKSLRRGILQKIFEKQNIIKTWRSIVKEQLRNTDILDIFDQYDFAYNIEERAKNVRSEVIRGTYKATQPLFYRIEKKYGICRHLIIPQPVDALILQVLIEFIYNDVISEQPSKKAFFSRDRHILKKPYEFNVSDISWLVKWKAMQTQIYKFNTAFEYIVVTDLSNYYDSINIDELKKVFCTYSKTPEVIFDLLFNIIEQISWIPDYLPYSHRGLPTSNIEAIRLLAHSFLYEIDKVLMEKTNDNFVRWMDDIVIGVAGKKEAIEILSSISDMLKSRGLSLNLAKTNIYSAEEGLYHFQIEQNEYLDKIFSQLKNNEPTRDDIKIIYRKFIEHLDVNDAKYWDKITRRYITFFSRVKCHYLLSIVSSLFIDFPNLRKSIISYLTIINYSKKTAEIILTILTNISIFDDISLFQLTNLVTTWFIPYTTDTRDFLIKFEDQIIQFSKKRKQPTDFFCLLWFKAKYSAPKVLIDFIYNFQNIWENDLFLRRQVTGVLARLLYLNDIKINRLLDAQFLSGNINIVTLANQLKLNSELDNMDNKINLYLFNKNFKKPYSLQRFLVLCSILNSPRIRENKDVRNKIKRFIFDPYYIRWISHQYYDGDQI
jgi:hypothetical protein